MSKLLKLFRDLSTADRVILSLFVGALLFCILGVVINLGYKLYELFKNIL